MPTNLDVLFHNRFSERFSQILHHVVFSFPSSKATGLNAGLDGNHEYEASYTRGDVEELNEAFKEPGESRALAGGIGPLSFAGSGYGVMLILMVSYPHRSESCS